jgi:HD-GYP domain-containing protein (c-di-GMP phosphodiesterase class II)
VIVARPGPKDSGESHPPGLSGALEGLEQLDVLTGAAQRLSTLAEENEGLAEEVLRGYEQLNLIFEITREIAPVTRPAEIERVLASRIGAPLRAEAVCVVSSNGHRQVHATRNGTPLSPEPLLELLPAIQDSIERVRLNRRVCVTSIEVKKGVRAYHVILGPLLRLDDKVDVVLGFRSHPAPEYTAGDMMLLDSLLTFGGQIISNSELHERLSRVSFQVTRALVAAIDQKDHYTSGHSERVGFLARLTGEQLGLRLEELQTLEWAGLLHDVGKIGVPEEILNKPGKLTSEEFDVIKKHPEMGYEILRPLTSFEGVLAAVLLHHETPDGSGYPRGLRGDETPLFARIVRVVDMFDALTSARSYRGAFTIPEAFEIIRKDSGTKVDREVASAFLTAAQNFARDYPAEFDAMFGRHSGALPSESEGR